MTERIDVVTEERIEKYLDITARALAKIRIAAPAKSYNRRLADSFLEMANCYYSDAKHFRECGDIVTAFAAVNYAHAWLDCGARIGLFDVDGDDASYFRVTLYPPAGGAKTSFPPQRSDCRWRIGKMLLPIHTYNRRVQTQAPDSLPDSDENGWNARTSNGGIREST